MVQWMKDGNTSTSDVVESDNGIYTSILMLSNIDTSDAGVYNCQAVVGGTSEYIIDSIKVNTAENISVISG